MSCACGRNFCVCIKDSRVEGGWAYLCLKCWNKWMPPADSVKVSTPYKRTRKKKRKKKA